MAAGFRQIPYRNAEIALSVNERLTSDHLIVCLPALGCSKESFDSLFAAPGLESYSICAVDLPGHGESDRPEDFTYGMDEHAKAVSLLIDQLAPARVSVVAHSMGGTVGLLLADHGVNVDRFVNIEGNLVSEDCGYASRLIASQSFQYFVDKGYADFLASLASSERADLQTWCRWLRETSPKALHEGALSLVELSDSEKLLRTFNALDRTTYVYGDEDTKDFLLPRLKRARVISISNAGHFSMLDNPAEFQVAVTNAMTLGRSVEQAGPGDLTI